MQSQPEVKPYTAVKIEIRHAMPFPGALRSVVHDAPNPDYACALGVAVRAAP
jgi:hypothetical protein